MRRPTDYNRLDDLADDITVQIIADGMELPARTAIARAESHRIHRSQDFQWVRRDVVAVLGVLEKMLRDARPQLEILPDPKPGENADSLERRFHASELLEAMKSHAPEMVDVYFKDGPLDGQTRRVRADQIDYFPDLPESEKREGVYNRLDMEHEGLPVFVYFEFENA